ncbi:MAG: CRISPR-associated endoribonuclease Cas6 [Cyanobacteria bacterium J06638_22]
MPRRRATQSTSGIAIPSLHVTTELVGLRFTLQALDDAVLYAQYTTGLHAWFLQQIQAFDPDLSAYLHDGESEKPFTITGLDGQFTAHHQQLQLQKGATYHWQLTALSKPVVRGIAQWFKQLPETLELRTATLSIQSVEICHPATTYNKLWKQAADQNAMVNLSFLSPTSFRRKGNHFPLPVPVNLFHSYLRRWNDFSRRPFEQDAFLDWVEDHTLIHQLHLDSSKIAAGKRGSVTGFTGAIRLGLTKRAAQTPDFHQLFYALLNFSPYCGTGHKTTFGLGQTQLGWLTPDQVSAPPSTRQTLLAERIAELTQIFMAQRKRVGGDRAIQISETWATVLARRELGESLQAIATDLGIPYETTKTYSKLARRSLREQEE